MPIPSILHDNLQIVSVDLVIGEDELVELGAGKGGTAFKDGKHLAVDLHVADQFEEQHQCEHGEAKS